MKISVNAWNAYRDKLARINQKAADLMQQYVDQNGLSDWGRLIDYAFAVSSRYGEAAASLACQMYDQTAAASGAIVPSAEPADAATKDEVASAIYGARKEYAQNPKVAQAVSRLVKRTASDTTLKNAIRDHAQFAWIPSGDGCAFCRMIASNGWQDASEKVLKGGHAEHIHANCKCEFAIRFRESDNVAGYDPDKYLREYNDASDGNWKDKIRAMERADYADNKDAINARKRKEYARRVDAQKAEKNNDNEGDQE